MGGTGSGQFGGKQAVEDCINISTADLLRYGYLRESAGPHSITWRNCLGHPLYTLTLDVRISGGALSVLLLQTGQVVALESTPLNFGGCRWWFKCPQCDRRCACLHRPRGADDFACRVCHELSYRSRQEHRSAGACGFSAATLANLARSRRPRWVRKRDRRPDYKPRGLWLAQLKKELGILF